MLYPGKLLVLSADEGVQMSLKQNALRWRERVVSVFRSWQLSPDVQAVVAALTVGDKSGLSSDLKSSYSAAGTSHVLALSGLHVGLLSAILLLVLSPLRWVRGGRWLLVVVSVCVLWFFAFITGLSPSVVRAVSMFTFYEVAFVLSESRFSGFYPLVLTAFCMLVYCPFYLFDVSFQLSFVAVFSILFFYPYFAGLFDIGNRAFRFVYHCIYMHRFAYRGFCVRFCGASLCSLLRSFPVEQIGAAVQWPAQQLLYKKHKKEAAAQKCATASHNSGYAIEQCSGTGDHRAAFAASICLISSGTTLNRSPTMP